MPQLNWIVPPELQGQMVEIGYCMEDGVAYRRTLDKADKSALIERCYVEELPYSLSWEPWNKTPEIPESEWEVIGEERDAQ